MVANDIAAIESENVATVKLFEMLTGVVELRVKSAEFVFVDHLNVGLSHENMMTVVFFIFYEIEAVVGAAFFDGDVKARMVEAVGLGKIAGWRGNSDISREVVFAEREVAFCVGCSAIETVGNDNSRQRLFATRDCAGNCLGHVPGERRKVCAE